MSDFHNLPAVLGANTSSRAAGHGHRETAEPECAWLSLAEERRA